MPVTSTGNYEQSPPGVVVVLTDTGGGDRSRTVTVRYRWRRTRVIVGAHSPRTGLTFTINPARGTCQWKGKARLGRKRFKLGLRSNGTGSSVVRVVSNNKRNGRSKTFRHSITIPNRPKKARKKA